jgi:hypothetical protein
MQTDIPLRTLTRIRPADLLPLLGSPDATVLGVESLELPSVATALDTLLRLRSAHGTIYLHLVEWQGYRDPLLLWRVLGYLGDLGRQYRGSAIVVTLVYLHPGDDVGGTLQQLLDGVELWSISFRVVRLWEQDARAAVASGLPGLAVLSPLMRGANAEVVEQAATLVLGQEAPGRQQADLLTILGLFAEPLMDTERFVHLVGRERLMASDLITYLAGERIAELEREHAAQLEQERVTALAALEREREHAAQLEQERVTALAALERERAALIQMVEDALIARFPTAPLTLAVTLRQVRDPQRLLELHAAVLQAPDQASVERLLQSR